MLFNDALNTFLVTVNVSADILHGGPTELFLVLASAR